VFVQLSEVDLVTTETSYATKTFAELRTLLGLVGDELSKNEREGGQLSESFFFKKKGGDSTHL
jgi:hypothetical protein